MKIFLATPPAARIMNPATLEPDLVPPKTWVPLGIGYLAGALRRAGFETDLADLHDHDWDAVEARLRELAPTLIGISCFTFGRDEARRLAALAKRIDPGVTVVMGGPHATFFPEQMLAGPDVDIVVMGEGEVSVVELAACLEAGGDLAQVAGIVFRRDGRILSTAPRPRVDSLDALAFPVYEAFDLAEYKSPELPAHFAALPGTHVLSSRGCPHRCTFCSVNRFFEGRWAFRSPENVVDELEFLVAERGVRHVYFSDDLFSLDPRRTVAICKEMLARGLELAWMAETRVDCVNAEMLGWMRKAGCHRVYYGVESGSPRILKAMRKGVTPAEIRAAFALSHAAGLEPCCFLMVGNPGESPETIAETVELIREIRPATPPIIGITTILPGTAQYETAKQRGVIDDDYWLSDKPPPLYTLEHDVDDLIYLQILLTRGICPELYEHMCEMGFDENFFRLRRMRFARN